MCECLFCIRTVAGMVMCTRSSMCEHTAQSRNAVWKVSSHFGGGCALLRRVRAASVGPIHHDGLAVRRSARADSVEIRGPGNAAFGACCEPKAGEASTPSLRRRVAVCVSGQRNGSRVCDVGRGLIYYRLAGGCQRPTHRSRVASAPHSSCRCRVQFRPRVCMRRATASAFGLQRLMQDWES